MKLIPDWKKVLLHAASVRWLIAAAVLTGAEAALPFFNDIFGLDPRWFAGLTFAIVGGALLSRIVAQKAFEEKDDDQQAEA
jgi:hypothetical protein